MVWDIGWVLNKNLRIPNIYSLRLSIYSQKGPELDKVDKLCWWYIIHPQKWREQVRFWIKIKEEIQSNTSGTSKMVSRNENKKHGDYISIDQEQYIKNITNRFEKVFKRPFKLKYYPLPTSLIPSKRNSPETNLLDIGVWCTM